MSSQSHQSQQLEMLTTHATDSNFNHSNYQPVTKHMVLLPKWFAEAEANNQQLFFYYQPIMECIKNLMQMGVYCFVLDWRASYANIPYGNHKYARRFEKNNLSQFYHFHIDKLDGRDLGRQANWEHILANAYIHFSHYKYENNFCLHVHDGTRYLDKRGFKMLPNQLLDAVLLPDNACTNYADDIDSICQPAEQAMQALLHYLEMLVSSVGKQYQQEIAEKRQQLQQKQAEFRAYQQRHSGWEKRVKPKKIDVICGGIFGSRKRKRHQEISDYVPLYAEELLKERSQRPKYK